MIALMILSSLQR